jgi:DNA-directed RNA polymerase subunit RPC12/RpoP
MENVVRLADYRKRRSGGRGRTSAQGAAGQYYCLRCDGDEFKLYASGVVHCAQCGSLMRNLLIDSKSEDAPQ